VKPPAWTTPSTARIVSGPTGVLIVVVRIAGAVTVDT
jgi:hypothetical protein